MKKLSKNKIPFGLKDGIMVQVSDVESGVACGCICPSCHRTLQANKGKIVSHYFSHDPTSKTKECESAFETSIHRMAKQILSEEGCAVFPALTIKLSQSDANGTLHAVEQSVEIESIRNFQVVELETRLDEIRPDIIVYENGTPYLIEVAVTHFADQEKKNVIRNLGLFAIEINLSAVSYTTTKEELRTLIIEKPDNKNWLSNPKAAQIKRKLQATLDEKIRLINEGINQGRRKLSTAIFTVRRNRNKVVCHTPRSTQKAPTQYELRWFHCEGCQKLFEVPVREAHYAIETIRCPKCNHAVSARPCMS